MTGVPENSNQRTKYLQREKTDISQKLEIESYERELAEFALMKITEQF